MKYSLVKEVSPHGVVYYYMQDENNKVINETLVICSDKDSEEMHIVKQDICVHRLKNALKPSTSIIKTIEI